jgi:Tfp pilus assembly protein PilF
MTSRLIGLALLVGVSLGCQPLRAQGPRTERVEVLEARARQDSCDAAALYNLAVAYITLRRYDEADSLLRVSSRIDPQFAEAFLGLSLVQARNNRYWDRLKHAGGDSAVAREQERRWSMARKAFLIEPDLDVMPMLAVVSRREIPNWYRLPKIADAESLLTHALAHERNDSTHTLALHTNDYRYLLAVLRQRAHQNTIALQLFEQVLEQDIGQYMAHVQMARIHESERDWFNAVRQRQAAVDVNPEDHTLVHDLGTTLIRAGRFTDAEAALQRASAMEPRFARTWLALGVAEMNLGRNDAAREALTHFLAIAPSRYDLQITDARKRLEQLPQP